MPRNRVMCEIHPESKRVIRVFRNDKDALSLPPERVRQFPKKDAVEDLRRQVFELSEGLCRNCGKIINWRFHMHELQHRGRGGEQSLENSIALCADCHLNQEHGDRRPQWLTRS